MFSNRFFNISKLTYTYYHRVQQTQALTVIFLRPSLTGLSPLGIEAFVPSRLFLSDEPVLSMESIRANNGFVSSFLEEQVIVYHNAIVVCRTRLCLLLSPLFYHCSIPLPSPFIILFSTTPNLDQKRINFHSPLPLSNPTNPILPPSPTFTRHIISHNTVLNPANSQSN